MGFGTYAVDVNAKSKVNRLFVLMMSSMGAWSFAFAISNSAPTAELSAFWGCCSVFGWGVFYSIMLHFALILTKAESHFNKSIMLISIYLPAFINIILFAPFGFLAEQQYEMVQSDFGWINVLPIDMGKIWFIAYYSVFTAVTLILIIRWWIKIESGTPKKRQATYFLISLLFPLFLGIITETIPDFLGKSSLPRITVVFLMLPVLVLSSTLRKSGLLLERPRGISLVSQGGQYTDEDRLRLFRTVAGIFTAGSSISFFIGYFAMKRPVGDEIFLAATLLLLGIFIRSIPRMTKKHSVQNTMFLAACVLSLFHIMIRNVERGGATIWTIYILFFVFTVILDSKLLLTIYAGLVIMIQIILLAINPEIPVIVDINEYMTRIALIILTYFAVRRLASEYALKLEAHKRFIKEQEVLENISTNFITINSENAHEKVYEMLEMSAEVLEFDYAYLVGFNEDHEDANVFSAYTKSLESDSLPYHPGMKIKTAAFPIIKTLIARGTPMICEDIINTPADGCEGTRNFFISRGINSFFAYPLQIAGRPIEGMLIFEYHEQGDKNLSENRSHFLNMIVNMLGDARKKTLYEEMIYDIAYFDESTKLANRNMLTKKLDQDINDIKGSEKIAVFNIELANIRMIKDSFGHNVVEQVMVKSAKMLESLLGNRSDIFRTSEGEFVVVLHGAKNIKQVEEHANRLLAVFSQPIATDMETGALFVAARIGISVYPDNGIDAKTLLKNADLAGYEAVSNNEDIIFYAKRLEEHIAENTLLTNKLFRSLQNKEFFLEYQPQVSCDTGKTVGVEALLRWTIEDDRRVPPNRFIPILEQTGLIYDVGLWVLEQALLEHNRLIAKGFPPLRFSVNLSVVQFEGEDFISDVAKIIKKSRVDPKYIEMEITESLFSKNPEEVLIKIYELKKLGVHIAIDDFGSGYSSYNRLKLVPFDSLKIDKAIIDYIDLEEEGAHLAENIISLARIFGASVIAEGVEKKEQLNLLKSMACDEIQGYYFSRPLPPEALEEFLKKE